MLNQPLADLGEVLSTTGLEMYAAHEGVDEYALLPDRLEIGRRDDGVTPAFSLHSVRREDTGVDAVRRSYGTLAFRVEAHYPAAELALAFLRRHRPRASLRYLSFSSGFLRLRPLGVGVDVPAALLDPMPLGWNGLGSAQFRSVLPRPAVELVRGMLEGGILALAAYAEMEFLGVAPRLPLVLEFDPRELARALRVSDDPSQTFTRRAVVQWFTEHPPGPSLFEVTGDRDAVAAPVLAEVVTDWVRTRFGVFAPAPTPDHEMHFSLRALAEAGRGRWRWNLAEPLVASRLKVLDLHPLDEARALVQRTGLDAIVEEVRISALDLGVVPVTISVHLPEGTQEIVGVDLHAAPAVAAGRPQALHASVELEPPRYAASAETPMPRLLSFSLRETPGYTFTPYVVLDGEKEKGEPIAVTAIDDNGRDMRDLCLFPDDFPVGFVPVRASGDLLAVADVAVTCAWDHAHGPPEPFVLTSVAPTRTLAIPRRAADVLVTITAHRRANPGVTLQLGPLPRAARYLIDLCSFAGYGPHSVEIEWQFAPAERSAVLELCPDGDSEVTPMRFDRDVRCQSYDWFARSPFTPGFKLRLRGEAAWRGPYPVTDRLVLSRAALDRPPDHEST